MITADNLHIYLAVRDSEIRSRLEDQLVLDGFEVSLFPSASELWARFQDKPARFLITDRRFEDSFGGLDLAGEVRRRYLMPYVYVIMLSPGNSLKEIKEGLAAGVDDYLIKPHNPFQLRSRILVGMRWLNYIDSLFADKQSRSERSGASPTELVQETCSTT